MTRQQVVRLKNGAVRGKAEGGVSQHLLRGASVRREPDAATPARGALGGRAGRDRVRADGAEGDSPQHYALLFSEVVIGADDCPSLGQPNRRDRSSGQHHLLSCAAEDRRPPMYESVDRFSAIVRCDQMVQYLGLVSEGLFQGPVRRIPDLTFDGRHSKGW